MTGFILMLIGIVLASFVAPMTIVVGQGKAKGLAFAILILGSLVLICGLVYFIIYDYPTMVN